MNDIPVKSLLAGVGGVVIIGFILGTIYDWAIRYDPGGPFSGVVSVIGMTGPIALILVGGGLLVVIGWLLNLVLDGGF
jgi:hypothetical protein